jgi:hypothetical protein
MTDVVLLVALVAFFVLAVAFLRACERIVGFDVEAEATMDATETDEVAA